MGFSVKAAGVIIVGLVLGVASIPFWVDGRQVEETASIAVNSAARTMRETAVSAAAAAEEMVSLNPSSEDFGEIDKIGLIDMNTLPLIVAKNGSCGVSIPGGSDRLIRIDVSDTEKLPRISRDGVNLPVIEIRMESDEHVNLAIIASGPAFWNITGDISALSQILISELTPSGESGVVLGLPASRIGRIDKECATMIWPEPKNIGAIKEARWTIGSAGSLEADRIFDEIHQLSGPSYIGIPGGHTDK